MENLIEYLAGRKSKSSFRFNLVFSEAEMIISCLPDGPLRDRLQAHLSYARRSAEYRDGRQKGNRGNSDRRDSAVG